MTTFPCATCKRSVRADVLCDDTIRFTPEDTPSMQIDWADVHYEVLQCRACRHLAFRETWTNSEDWTPEDGPEEHVKIYPDPTMPGRAPRVFHNLPGSLSSIYSEVIGAFNNGLFTLCAAGLRALIEGMCVEQGVTEGPVEVIKKDGTKKIEVKPNLQGKIGGMAERRLLSQRHAQLLHRFRFLGNNAVHQLKTPKKANLAAAIDVLEHTLENVYVIDGRAQEIG